jgi:peptidoglycan biosynthesis protein MviN/MurJ (putative lipid II flippase)
MIIRTVLFLVLLFIVISLAYLIYRITTKKIKKEEKINAILMKTEEGQNYLEEGKRRNIRFVEKILPFFYGFLFVLLLTSIVATIWVIKYYLEKGFKNFVLDDLKLLAYPGMSIYLRY